MPDNFNRDSWASWYAQEHLKTDPGIEKIFYLPTNADAREIRFVEINTLSGDRTEDSLEPIDFGIDTGTENAHRLFVLDVTPAQWQQIQSDNLSLPNGWSLDDLIAFPNDQFETLPQ
ncbi:hypothetical protein [Gimesia sp.]|uniref:hypothetical protein n=1 Tax=Gimesia sp. TaxID=2024833 RepID=UPI000C3672A2|nr:hypothetical protein [Gimesia sp.]MAX40348.1 hypothetical protein [Gimesia sp.]HAH43755.1 hypothetical protein [Planctomycetaceae bacterium]HBL43181.1 hypothetical protein [Planctomycetaceae bacterium]|tara:strand:- start:189 stop:539 length:351 start_codon:yes stop_codon:yes gene_type:complete